MPYKNTSPFAAPLPPGVAPFSDPWASENYTGMPDIPAYHPIYDPSSMGITEGLDKRLNGIQMNRAGLDAFREQAMRKGPSSWALLARKDQMAQAKAARDRGAQEVGGQNAQAMDRLAASGGLSSGARERVALGGAHNYMDMSQGVARDQNLNNLQIGMNDEQNRIQQLSQLPGMELQAIQPDLQKAQAWETAKATDTNNWMQNNQSLNAYNSNLYNQKMSAWAADKQATATANSGKK